MVILGKDTSIISRLKKELSHSFAMKDLGSAKQILGMQITGDLRLIICIYNLNSNLN